MAAINDLIQQIKDPELREQIEREVSKLAKQKKFGLVFEEHLPECTPLYDVPVRRGRMVARKTGKVSDTFVVLKIEGETATCLPKDGSETQVIPVKELVTVAEFGEPIYPYLKPMDSVCNAPDSDLWHTLIEADNYHALQLLEYLYAGKVDCIYIDPPYNTGARDWKYNNDYVDGADTYRHSKWLSFMQKRLKLAKKLLNPKDSVLIVTIDEKEYLHLGCLLEEMFPEAKVQMVTSVINPKGSVKEGLLTRCEEYLYFVVIGRGKIVGNNTDFLFPTVKASVRWPSLKRTGTNSMRSDRPNLFYPLLYSTKTGKFVKPGRVLDNTENRMSVEIDSQYTAVWPLDTDGNERIWQLGPDSLVQIKKEGLVDFGRLKNGNATPYYVSAGLREQIKNGEITVTGYRSDGVAILEYSSGSKAMQPKTVWNMTTHSASEHGTNLIKNIFQGKRFSFPKSLFAVKDALQITTGNKKEALIVDFFAGSGTTLHAVNLLNAEDGGHRRCIMVTNNEVSAEENKTLTAQGYQPGDPEWEKLGISRYVTWPRTVCSIEGHDVNGKPLKGNYLGSDRPMADGFNANAAFFKLGFLDKNAIALGRQFKEMLPTLWMKACAYGPCPRLDDEETPPIRVLPQNRFAVLTEESAFSEFEAAVRACPQIRTVYIVTDYEAGYRAMARSFDGLDTYQLYRDYLDNFRINTGRN